MILIKAIAVTRVVPAHAVLPKEFLFLLAAPWGDLKHRGGGTGAAGAEQDFGVQRGKGCRADRGSALAARILRCWAGGGASGTGANPREARR